MALQKHHHGDVKISLGFPLFGLNTGKECPSEYGVLLSVGSSED